MDFNEEVVPGYRDLVNPKKKKEVVQCPKCDEMELERVKKNLWVCQNCGFEISEDEE